ncbi:MAG: NAD-dependent epimerase/dehydratase family protein [Methanoregula sp.]|jgi:UDP-glucose 4-epimerase|uniref:NAD-dependent epimerase/dehydratase family protein n=1 Tax=Methanoregula sp. TaxID=2052170 RepID=UPI003D0AF99A
MTRKKIIVTGGAGFIGSHIARRLRDTGYDVVVVDNLVTGTCANLPEGVDFIQGDISKKSLIASLPDKGVFAVLHLAAQSSGEISQEKPELDLKVNTLGTLQLLQWCAKHHVPRFMYASSMAIYGDVTYNPVPETQSCNPLSFYGISKLSSEQYIQHFSREGLDTTCFRMFSVYGPGQNMTNMKQGMVSIFLAYLMNGEEIWVKGSKDRFRDFIYIDDVVDVWCSSLENKKTYGKIYNLATGQKTTVGDLVRIETKMFGEDPEKYPIKFEGSTPADQFGLYADITFLKKDLSWKPRITLEKGLREMIAWVKKEYQVK